MAGNQDSAESPTKQPSFKEQLDHKADEKFERIQENKPNPIVEKITEYIPAAKKVLGTQKPSEPAVQTDETPGPPSRPDHDPSIEEFVRDQHRSMKEDGTLTGIGGS